jgi:hypothetical protein
MLRCTALVLVMLATAFPVVAQDDASALPDGAGKPIVQKMCVGCHNLKTVTSQHATKEQWSSIVQQMVSRGAEGTDEEIETVVDYLAKSFPPLDKDKPASADSFGFSFEQGIHSDLSPNVSLLTMSQADLHAMLRHWQQHADRSQSVRSQQ